MPLTPGLAPNIRLEEPEPDALPPGEEIVIEDAPELKLDHPNAIGLIGVRGELGEARVDAEMLLQAALLMRPDRSLLGELRGGEAVTLRRSSTHDPVPTSAPSLSKPFHTRTR